MQLRPAYARTLQDAVTLPRSDHRWGSTALAPFQLYDHRLPSIRMPSRFLADIFRDVTDTAIESHVLEQPPLKVEQKLSDTTRSRCLARPDGHGGLQLS